MAGRFAGLSKVRTNQGGLYFGFGKYRVVLDLFKFQVNRKRIDQFFAECTVIQSDNPSLPVGSKPSYCISMNPEYYDSAAADLKKFIGVLLGLDNADSYVPDDGSDVDAFWEGAVEDAISDSQPHKGVELDLVVVPRPRQGKEPFPVHTWSLAE
jgi:hypothetical protein